VILLRKIKLHLHSVFESLVSQLAGNSIVTLCIEFYLDTILVKQETMRSQHQYQLHNYFNVGVLLHKLKLHLTFDTFQIEIFLLFSISIFSICCNILNQCSEIAVLFKPISEARPTIPPLPSEARRPSRRSRA